MGFFITKFLGTVGGMEVKGFYYCVFSESFQFPSFPLMVWVYIGFVTNEIMCGLEKYWFCIFLE